MARLVRSIAVAAPALLALLSGTSAVSAANAGVATTTVPVVVCPTTLGITGPQVPVAHTEKVPAPAANLVVYSATSAYVQLLGPKGLACKAGIGADGSGSVTAAPEHAGSLDIGRGGVEAVAYPSCVGCLLSLACPFFPAAHKAATQDGFGCPTPPKGQLYRRVDATTVDFSDPADVSVPAGSANLVPSGSPDPADGVVVYATYLYKGKYAGSVGMEALCVLPAAEHATCTTVLDEFLATEVKKFVP